MPEVLERPEVVSAAVTARSIGARVEVTGLRDEFSQTFVNPDGSLTTEAHAGVQRFRESGSTQWREVDLDLVAGRDGSVAAKGHPLGLRLAGRRAGGGSVDLVSVGADATVTGRGAATAARSVSLAWNGKLPTPVLDGRTATYRGVSPGVDLVVESRRSGFEQFFRLADRSAVPASGGLSWSFTVRTKGLTARPDTDGGVSFVDAKGKVAARIPPALAWDAVVDEASGDPVNVSPVALEVAQRGKGLATLTVRPDAAWLADPARVFPVTVDPTYASASVAPGFDAYVQSNVANTDYSTATELRVGTYDGSIKARSFINFPTSTIRGKQVQSASLSLYEFHSYSCTAAPVYAQSTSGVATSATRWSSQPGVTGTSSSASFAKGYSSSCPGGRVSIPVTAQVQGWSASTATTQGLRLWASETSASGWKKFYSIEGPYDPVLSFTYNRKPNAAAAATLQTPPANSYTAPNGSSALVFTTDSTPQFATKATDPDGNTVAMTVEVHSSQTVSSSTLKASCTTAFVASGATGTCSPTTALADNGMYYVRVAVKDQLGLWNGTWSPWTTFYTSWTAPPAPKITCPAPYDTNGSWVDTAPTGDLTCTVSAPGVAGTYVAPGYIDLTVDGVAKPRVKITASGDPNVAKTTVTIPKAAGAHTVTAVALSRSLVASPKATFSVGWGGASLTAPKPKAATSGQVSVAAGGPPRGNAAGVSARLRWRVAGAGSETTGWTDGPALTVPAVAASSPVSASGSWDVRSAVREAGASADLPTRTPVLLDVQVCFAYTGVTAPQCTWSQSPTSVTRVPHAFGAGYPTADAGPGQVALFTGEFNTSATDVSVPGYTGDLSIGRSHTSYAADGAVAGWPTDPVTGVFGPGWTASLQGPDAGAAGLTVVDNTRLDGTIVLVDEQGEPWVFQTPTRTRTYPTDTAAGPADYLPATQDTEDADVRLTLSGTGPGMVLTLIESDNTRTVWQPVTYSTGADTDWKPVSVSEPGVPGATSYGHDASGRVTRIVASVPAGTEGTSTISCPTSGPLARGCRALDISYATTNSASFPGDFAGRVTSVTATLWDPKAAAMRTVTVASYGYDSAGRLVRVSDPRTGMVTEYGWEGTSTRLAWVKEPGLAAYRIAYDLTTPSTPKVSAVTRDAPVAGGAPVTLARYVYSVPLTGGNDGPPDLSATTVGTWFQAKAPVTGYAVFGPDWTGPVTGAGVDWTHADLQYADEQGYTVNTASFGAGTWQVTATDYDTWGNVIRELGADAVARVRDAMAAGEPLNSGQVDALSNQTLYRRVLDPGTGRVIAEAGAVVTDTYGPARNAALDDGTVLPVRPHIRTDYDQNAPNQGINPATGQAWRLPTTITTGVADAGAAPDGGGDLETVSTTVNDYTKLNPGDTSEGDGWTLGLPSRVTTGGITRTTRYDTAGRVTQTRQPLSTGDDAGTTLTSYYTAQAGDPVCGGKPEWAGLVCRAAPAAAPATTGTPANGPAVLPDQHTAQYSMWLAPVSVVETAGTLTRTTTTQFDDAGRPTATWVTSTVPGSTARPGTFTKYNPTTGLVDYTGALNTARDDADPTARTSTRYDLWGRVVSLTNDLGETTITGYDAAGRVASVIDPTGTTTYGYDGTDAAGNQERRGLTTSITITRAGTAGPLSVTGAYDAAGNLTTQRLPGGITQRTGYDEAGEPVAVTYTGQVTPVTETTDPDTGETTYTPGAPQADQPWLAWTITNDVLGRVRAETTGPAAAFDGLPGVSDPSDITAPTLGQANPYERQYQYDRAGRLVKVTDRTTSHSGAGATEPCLTRQYGFDANGRRTTLTTSTHADGDCASTADVTRETLAYAYDTADRPTTGANGAGTYTYDAFGRQTVLPAPDAPDPQRGDITLGYYDDDLARTITQGTTSTQFTLDSAGRRLRATTTTTDGSTSTLIRHYTDASDNPAWTENTTALGETTITRYGETIGGDLGLTIDGDGDARLTLANPHGDVVTTVTIPASQTAANPAEGIDGWADYTEYGSPRDGAAAQPVAGAVGYGWLGTKQRSATGETAGLTLMGARLYNARTGRFTSPDPVPGGNDTTYNYPNDPTNAFDLDGQRRNGKKGCGGWKSWGCKAWNATGSASRWLTNSKWGERIQTACSFAWGAAGAACGVVYGAAYARQGKWRKAAGAAAGIAGGGLAKRAASRAFSKVRFSHHYKRREVRAYRRAFRYSAELHGLAAGAASSRLVGGR